MTIDELISVCQSAKQGKKVQHENLSYGEGEWREYDLEEEIKNWNLRVAPEPREIWVSYSSGGFLSDRHYDSQAEAASHGGKPALFREAL